MPKLTEQQRKEFEVALQSFGQHRATMEAQAIAFENMHDKHLRNCGKHFANALKEIDKGIEELEREVAELENQP